MTVSGPILVAHLFLKLASTWLIYFAHFPVTTGIDRPSVHDEM